MSTAGADVPESVTLREAQEIIRAFGDSGWKAMTLELRGLRIVVGKDGPPTSTAAAAPPASAPPAPSPPASAPPASPASAPPEPPRGGPAATERRQSHPVDGSADHADGAAGDTTGCVAVRSPAVGAFWVAPSPGEAPFVEVGQRVSEEQQLGIVEVMKLMNPVLTTVTGEIVRVCAANSELVEYDQVLFWIRPDDD